MCDFKNLSEFTNFFYQVTNITSYKIGAVEESLSEDMEHRFNVHEEIWVLEEIHNYNFSMTCTWCPVYTVPCYEIICRSGGFAFRIKYAVLHEEGH